MAAAAASPSPVAATVVDFGALGSQLTSLGIDVNASGTPAATPAGTENKDDPANMKPDGHCVSTRAVNISVATRCLGSAALFGVSFATSGAAQAALMGMGGCGVLSVGWDRLERWCCDPVTHLTWQVERLGAANRDLKENIQQREQQITTCKGLIRSMYTFLQGYSATNAELGKQVQAAATALSTVNDKFNNTVKALRSLVDTQARVAAATTALQSAVVAQKDTVAAAAAAGHEVKSAAGSLSDVLDEHKVSEEALLTLTQQSIRDNEELIKQVLPALRQQLQQAITQTADVNSSHAGLMSALDQFATVAGSFAGSDANFQKNLTDFKQALQIAVTQQEMTQKLLAQAKPALEALRVAGGAPYLLALGKLKPIIDSIGGISQLEPLLTVVRDMGGIDKATLAMREHLSMRTTIVSPDASAGAGAGHQDPNWHH